MPLGLSRMDWGGDPPPRPGIREREMHQYIKLLGTVLVKEQPQ